MQEEAELGQFSGRCYYNELWSLRVRTTYLPGEFGRSINGLILAFRDSQSARGRPLDKLDGWGKEAVERFDVSCRTE